MVSSTQTIKHNDDYFSVVRLVDTCLSMKRVSKLIIYI